MPKETLASERIGFGCQMLTTLETTIPLSDSAFEPGERSEVENHELCASSRENRCPQGVNHETRPALVFGREFSFRRNRV